MLFPTLYSKLSYMYRDFRDFIIASVRTWTGNLVMDVIQYVSFHEYCMFTTAMNTAKERKKDRVCFNNMLSNVYRMGKEYKPEKKSANQR